MTYSVRRAEAWDVPWLLPELEDFSRLPGTKYPLFPDIPDAAFTVHKLICDHPFFICEHQDDEEDSRQRCGFIAGFESTHPFNPRIRVLTEMFWWVAQPWRGTRAAYELMRAFTDYGVQHCDWILCSVNVNTPVDPRSLQRFGYRPFEHSLLLEV